MNLNKRSRANPMPPRKSRPSGTKEASTPREEPTSVDVVHRLSDVLAEPFDIAIGHAHRGEWRRYAALVEEGTSARDPEAVHETAQWYLHGHSELGIGIEPGYAVFLLTEVRERGARAAYDLGVCHELGVGTKKDVVQAYACYKTAGHLGSLIGREALARCFAHGIGVSASLEQAQFVISTLKRWAGAMPGPEPRGLLAPRWIVRTR